MPLYTMEGHSETASLAVILINHFGVCLLPLLSPTECVSYHNGHDSHDVALGLGNDLSLTPSGCLIWKVLLERGQRGVA